MVQRNGMEVRRFGPDPAIAPPEAVAPGPDEVLPAWALRPAAAEALQRFASPSRLGDEIQDAVRRPLRSRRAEASAASVAAT